MQVQMRNSGLLANSWYGETTDSTKNTIDVSCVSSNGANTVLINSNPVLILASTGIRDEYKGYTVGYKTPWTVTVQGSGAYCTVKEYTSSPTQDFMINGDFSFLFLVTLYILFFAI